MATIAFLILFSGCAVVLVALIRWFLKGPHRLPWDDGYDGEL